MVSSREVVAESIKKNLKAYSYYASDASIEAMVTEILEALDYDKVSELAWMYEGLAE